MGNSAGREGLVKAGDVVEGRYRIIKTLGEGGMGTVFLAEHALIKRRVAIKILHPELATDANVIERFMNEARAAGTLGHPNIVESTDMGFTHNHVPYIVFEYLEGSLLTDEVYRVGGLPVRRAVRIAQQIASALNAAHNANIVHRDLKSDNVFLTDKDDAMDHVKVLDFGISRFLESEDEQTRRGMIMGTPEFMAPEQITAPDSVDKRADIYALGVIIYEMLTARRPFSNDEDPRALLHRIVHNEPPPLQRAEVPHALDQMILTKMLAKAPGDRYQTMMDVEAALDAFTTQGDGASRVRRSRPIAVVSSDVASDTTQIPRGVMSAQTPWPGPQRDTIDPMPEAMKHVSLQPPPRAKPWMLYGLAGGGLLVGVLGLGLGLRGGSGDKVAATPPVAQPLPAAAVPAPRQEAPSKVEVRLDSNVANAHVTFRRRVSSAPATLQIAPSDIVELVEVTAPGYKTVRYWLTFDRPTHLNAHLVKGGGIGEASEEETLVALGEVAAPSQPAVAAAAPAATATKVADKVADTTKPAAKTIDKPVVVAAIAPPTTPTATPAAVPTPRKIGRAAAEETQTAVAKTEPATNAPVPSVVDPFTPTTTAAIQTNLVPKAEAPVAIPDPVAPEPAKVEPPKAEPALTVAEPAHAAAIDMATVSSVVSTHRPEVLKCFAEGKKKDHAMKGTLQLQLQVDGAGKVKRVQVQSTLNNPLVAACVVRSANAWHFPGHSGAELASVNYPFTIN